MVIIGHFFIKNYPIKRTDPKMTRAKRHYIPGHVWHLGHRCDKRQGWTLK